jgi:hypothetical protein
MTIYRLPTQGRTANPYRGSYPNRVASFSGSRGAYHVELNNGARYVFTRNEVLAADARLGSLLGMEFSELTGRNPHDVERMTVADYAGVMFVIRTCRVLQTQTRNERRAVERDSYAGSNVFTRGEADR